MAKFKVKLGHHGINGKVYKEGDTIEIADGKLADGDGARFFEKLADQSAAEAGEGGKGKGRGKGKGKPEAGEGSESAAAETGEAKPANPEA